MPIYHTEKTPPNVPCHKQILIVSTRSVGALSVLKNRKFTVEIKVQHPCDRHPHICHMCLHAMDIYFMLKAGKPDITA